MTAYGTLANGGKAIGHTTILTVKDASGKDVVPPYVPPAGKQVVSPQAAYIVTDILAGNTNPNVNPFWGKFAITGPTAAGRRRSRPARTTTPRTSTPTATSRRRPTTGRDDGRLRARRRRLERQQRQQPRLDGATPLFSIDVSTYVWQGFLNEATRQVAGDELQAARTASSSVAIDPFTGLRRDVRTRTPVDEWFIAGTEPQDRARRRTRAASTSSPSSASRRGFDAWMKADRDWLRRAERGPGVAGGPDRTRTAYFYNSGVPAVRRRRGARWSAASCGEPQPVADVLSRPDAGRRAA